ncbi:hypothetical protein BCh11DRAFT_05814 [Burkholderia sp. Ch1-1]|uniref:Transmembrane protein n=1 Tax=Paraburkholderia dioscoreae TaxID=2604047 RepID=A0A5Q4Z7H3_9BURK|nr:MULTISPECIES: hypothetical protein [Paraburkholderia]EIF30328.1 hypothetical protein BCh11DRAFT_05814 [Burkholderia sp. Ch1-1]MDR8399191.1 hypothetical protein [Paraburkholderia sp. USG1]VVD29585.1 conserved protein of unknown function [Paraburkholderia dioscoreae]
MHILPALELFAAALALLCVALVPVAIRRDPGLARPIVRMDALPRARWPNLLMRGGIACLLLSFAWLLVGCYYLLASAGD